MPLAYKDFAPFFKFISNDYIYTANKTITASRIVFWDDTVLDGNVTLFINNARIGNTNRRIRRRLTYPCNQMSYRVRTNKDQNLLLLPGTIVPPGRLPLAAMSNTINLASGYSFGTTVDNVGRSLRDTTIDPNDETFNQQNVLMPVDGYIRLGTKNKIIPINGASFLKTIALGIRVAIKETDKSIVDGNCQVILYENTLKYQTRIAKYITCTIMNIVQGEPPFDLIGIFQCATSKNISTPRCFNTTVTVEADSENKTVDIVSAGDVIIPEGGTSDISTPGVDIYNYPNGFTIWGLTSNGAMSIVYYSGETGFTIKTEGTKFFYDNVNTIEATSLTLLINSTSTQSVSSFYNNFVRVDEADISGSIVNYVDKSVVKLDSANGYITLGPLKTYGRHTIEDYKEFTINNDLIGDPNGYTFNFVTLDAKYGDTLLTITNGGFNFNGIIMSLDFGDCSLDCSGKHYKLKYTNPVTIWFGLAGTINNVTDVDINWSNGFQFVDIIIIGGSADLKNNQETLSIGPNNIESITYLFNHCELINNSVVCDTSYLINNGNITVEATYMGSTHYTSHGSTYQLPISKYT